MARRQNEPDSESETRTDPTISTSTMAAGDPYPEGTHPVRSASETTHSATRIEYRDATDDEKPDPTSIVQYAEIPDDMPGQ